MTTEILEGSTMKGFIDPYFFITPFGLWKLWSFIDVHAGPGFLKKDCLYFYKEGLQNICKSSKFDDEQKTMAKNLIDTYKADKNRLKLLANTARSANSTLYTTFTQADVSVSCYKTPEKQITTDHDISPIEPNPFIVESSQGRKHDLEDESNSEEEYDAEQIIVCGKSISWLVDGINIRDKLTEYQEIGLPKMRPEYYDVILFTDKNQDMFLGALEENIVVQMHNDIKRNDEGTKCDIEENIKSFLNNIIVRDINKTKENLKLRKNVESFEKDFALIELMEDVNVLLEDMSEGSFIVMVLAPILNKFFMRNKKIWYPKYGETCLKANAEDHNSQKTDNERRSPGKKIDTIIILKEDNEEFSVTEVSGPPNKNDWSHFVGDRLKIAKMLKTLMNRFAKLRPGSDIRMVRLYGMQLYLCQVIIYEFQLKYSEIYTMEEVLKFPLPKTWKDMKNAHESIIGFLRYERLLSESSTSIGDFLWTDGDGEAFQGMTTRMIHSPKSKRTNKKIRV
ncbi:16937_t:CDS:2 [Funneliformis geosporum]|uniref:16937_t:CDS:1 n=1 Tax=Funneliformis geosporum TaxID=1117311 RepID=A0A9W4WQB7_9GLOM|nr:16937_t:CDS:2 [Funneliformis geosporum]